MAGHHALSERTEALLAFCVARNMLLVVLVREYESMSYPDHLTRAPITEAVLNVAIDPVVPWRKDVFDAFCEAAQVEFPDSKPIQQLQTDIAFSVAKASIRSADPQSLGYICWNREKTRAVQARVDGFSVNHVKGYENWGALLEHGRQWWAHYRRRVAPERVRRCGVRFINQFELAPGQDLSVSLRTRPELGPGLPQELEEYFQRVVIPFPGGIRGAITQAIAPEASTTPHPKLVLDIDVSLEVNLDTDSDDIWAVFERLRSIKNQCFFESLQPDKWKEFR